jgi:hypothetical protein
MGDVLQAGSRLCTNFCGQRSDHATQALIAEAEAAVSVNEKKWLKEF